jgi:hypothetical protein
MLVMQEKLTTVREKVILNEMDELEIYFYFLMSFILVCKKKKR